MRPGVQIVARALVPGSRAAVFAYLADLSHHWTLADRFVEVVRLDGQPANGGVVRLRGPLGTSRTVVTRVSEVCAPSALTGTATVGRGTVAHVRWALDEHEGQTAVTLEATVVRAARADALLLRLGGRRWLARRFARVLDRLAERFVEHRSAPPAGEPLPAPSSSG